MSVSNGPGENQEVYQNNPVNGSRPPGDATESESTGNTPRPIALTVIPENIPADLREQIRWVLWKYELRQDKSGKWRWTKPPFSAHTGGHADSTVPGTWAPYDKVLAAYQAGGWDGIGYVIHPDEGLGGIDLDHCRDPDTGELSEQAAAIVAEMRTYTEVSPSGTGLRLLARACRGDRQRSKRGPIEMYDGRTKKGEPGGRYLTITGHHLPGTPKRLEMRQVEFVAVYRRELLCAGAGKGKAEQPANGHSNGETTSTASAASASGLSDEEILRLLRGERNGKAARLLDGNTEGYPSPSEADSALAAKVAFYTKDAGQIARLLRGSALWREKLDRQDYLDSTINNALGLVTEQYRPKRRNAGKVGSNGQSGPPGDNASPNGTPPPVWPPPAVVALRAWLEDCYCFTFRRGRHLYSAKLGRDVSISEVSGTPTLDALERLAGQPDAPRLKGSSVVDPQALPYHYRNWLPTAWGEVASGLPEEADAPEVVEPAAEEFKRKLSVALLTMVPLAYRYGKESERDDVQRRPLVEWARLFATKPRWESVRGYRIWSRKQGDLVRVAIRAELLGQLHGGDLRGLSQRRLTDLCHLYGLGTACWVEGKIARATELTADYLADLLAQPANDDETRTQDDQTHAPACEDASVRPG